MPKYRKLYPRFWRNRDVRSLSTDEKLIAAYCLTGEQTNRVGIFVFSRAMAAECLGMLPDTFRERFGTVVRTMGWMWDDRSDVLLLPTWWEWNRPENGNVLKSCLNDLEELPETPLLAEFLAIFETYRERFWNVPVTLPERMTKRMPNQEQEQEQEQEQINTNVATKVAESFFEKRPEDQTGPKTTSTTPKKSAESYSDEFEAFWKAYPPRRREGKAKTYKAYKIALGRVSGDVLARAVIEYAQSPVGRGEFVKSPAAWLNQGCWDDDRAAWQDIKSSTKSPELWPDGRVLI